MALTGPHHLGLQPSQRARVPADQGQIDNFLRLDDGRDVRLLSLDVSDTADDVYRLGQGTGLQVKVEASSVTACSAQSRPFLSTGE